MTDPPTPTRPVCPCGHDRHHRRVQPILGFGPWRWALAVLVGTEMPPREVRFVCAVCDTELERARDRQSLAKYGRWSRAGREALRARDTR